MALWSLRTGCGSCTPPGLGLGLSTICSVTPWSPAVDKDAQGVYGEQLLCCGQGHGSEEQTSPQQSGPQVLQGSLMGCVFGSFSVCVGTREWECVLSQSSTCQFHPLAAWAGGGLAFTPNVPVGSMTCITSIPEALLLSMTHGKCSLYRMVTCSLENGRKMIHCVKAKAFSCYFYRKSQVMKMELWPMTSALMPKRSHVQSWFQRMLPDVPLPSSMVISSLLSRTMNGFRAGTAPHLTSPHSPLAQQKFVQNTSQC